MKKDTIIIFDTTLRDGEQSPGATMSLDEKVRIAKMLEKLKVDVIEAGFASASPGDFEAVKAVAATIKDSTICSLSRAIKHDIEQSAQALKPTDNARIHTFIATSPIHMKYKLKMQPDEVIEQAVKAVTLAKNFVDDVEFSLEDGGRSEFDFMCRIIEKAIDAGARTINIPDTVGYTIPTEYGSIIGNIINTVVNADKAVFSVHCHNDLGLAVANSLAAIEQGARQVECTINGLGERAGNASLEEIVMAIKTRSDIVSVTTDIATEHIVPTSKLVSTITGFAVQPNKAIVGANAFAHEAGIHQDGVLKNRETYEIMQAEQVGWSANKLILGKHSGRAAVKKRIENIGIIFTDEEKFSEYFKQFKLLADKKHEIFDEDLHLLMSHRVEDNQHYHLEALTLNKQPDNQSFAQLKLLIDGRTVETSATGDGLVDAAFKAIEKQVNSGSRLELYTVNAITEGTESQGEVTVRLHKDGRIINGVGADTDIITASVYAYLDALNRFALVPSIHPQD